MKRLIIRFAIATMDGFIAGITWIVLAYALLLASVLLACLALPLGLWMLAITGTERAVLYMRLIQHRDLRGQQETSTEKPSKEYYHSYRVGLIKGGDEDETE